MEFQELYRIRRDPTGLIYSMVISNHSECATNLIAVWDSETLGVIHLFCPLCDEGVPLEGYEIVNGEDDPHDRRGDQDS